MGISVNPAVCRFGQTVFHPPFKAENTRLHIGQVILSAFLELRVVALLLELFSLEVVAWVVFIGDGQRYDVECFQTFSRGAFTTHGHHLQY